MSLIENADTVENRAAKQKQIESEHEKLVHPTLTHSHTHTESPACFAENSHKKGEEKKYRPSAKCTFRCVKNRQTAAQLATTIEKQFKVAFITRAAYTIAGAASGEAVENAKWKLFALQKNKTRRMRFGPSSNFCAGA
jgi:hypothetical protein